MWTNKKVVCPRKVFSKKKIGNFESFISYHKKASYGPDNINHLHELFKVFKGLSAEGFAEAFPVRQQSQYNMKNYSCFVFRYALCQTGQPKFTKFAIHRFKIVGQCTIPYKRFY